MYCLQKRVEKFPLTQFTYLQINWCSIVFFHVFPQQNFFRVSHFLDRWDAAEQAAWGKNCIQIVHKITLKNLVAIKSCKSMY